MDNIERQRIISEAYATVDRLRDFEVEHRNAGGEDALERWAAGMPQKGPDLSAYTDFSVLVDQRIATAIIAERERAGDVLAEMVAAERAFVLETVGQAIGEMLAEEHKLAKEALSGEVRLLRIELTNLEATVAELRTVIANEAKRGEAQRNDDTADVPQLPVRRDLN
jgi:hypothetical protein